MEFGDLPWQFCKVHIQILLQRKISLGASGLHCLEIIDNVYVARNSLNVTESVFQPIICLFTYYGIKCKTNFITLNKVQYNGSSKMP